MLPLPRHRAILHQMNTGDVRRGNLVGFRPPVQETDAKTANSDRSRHEVQEFDIAKPVDVACIHLMQDGPAGPGGRAVIERSVAEAALDELAVAALADEEAVADDGPTPDEHGPDGAPHG